MNERKDLARELRMLGDRDATVSGRTYWRSLDELADTPAFRELMQREFPEQATVWPEPLDRRRFLTLMGASLALAGLTGCSIRPAPTGTIVPQVRAPEEVVPGRPLFYATAMTLGGTGVGLLVESHLGRPTKIEGNPDHPSSLGATDPFHQASVLTLYDPDRSQTVTHLGRTRTWEEAQAALRTATERHRSRRGAGLRILSESIVSPTLARQVAELLTAFPDAKWHVYEPLARDSAYRAAQQAFGEPVNTCFRFEKADVVVALDADFLTSGPGSLRHTRDFMARRRVRTSAADAGGATMNRLYTVESMVSNTGAKADHRLALRASEIEEFARALAIRLGIASVDTIGDAHRRWIDVLARDLELHRGRSVIVAGDRQPAAVHLLAHAINHRLGNVGDTVIYTDPIEAMPTDHASSLTELALDMEAGRVETLLILDANPVHSAPADLRFAERLQRVPLLFHLGLYQDETARRCHWHLPQAHYLEAWSDTRAHDGTATIMQPLIEPLYHGRSIHEVVRMLTEPTTFLEPPRPRQPAIHEVVRMLTEPTANPGQELVRATWRAYWERHRRGGDFLKSFWQMAAARWRCRRFAIPPAYSVASRRLAASSRRVGRICG